MKRNELIRNNTTFIVQNNVRDSLLYHRNPIHYELNGMMYKTFNDTKRLAMSYSHYINDFSNIIKLKEHKQYNFSLWVPSPNVYVIKIVHNYKKKYRTKDFLKMVYYNAFDEGKFMKMAKELVILDVELFIKEKND